LDDIRQRAGVDAPSLGPGAAWPPRDESVHTQASTATAGPGSAQRGAIDGLLAASRGAPADLSSLRPAAIVVALAAAVTVFAHPAFAAWVDHRLTDQAGRDGLIDFSWVFDWLSATLTVAAAHRWAPLLAGVVLVALVIVAAVTTGFRQGRSNAAIALMVAGALGALASLPLLLATVLAVIAAVLYVLVYIVVYALVLAAGLFVLAGLFTR
jgi:hypothetical protein